MSDSTEDGVSGWKDRQYWSKLAIEDPERLERERKEAIEEILSGAPDGGRERLERLQWRIDVERARASNPLSSCLRVSRMMWEYFYAENGFLRTINNWAGTNCNPPHTRARERLPPRTEKVITLPKKE